MKLTKIKLTGLGAVVVLIFCSFGVYAAENQEATPTPMNKDQVEGRVGEAKGKVKEATGVLQDDQKKQTEGNVKKKLGKAQKGYGDRKKEIEQGE